LYNLAFPPSVRYRSPSAPRVALNLGIAQPGYASPVLYNTAIQGVQQTLVTDGLYVPLVDAYHQVDPNLAFASVATQNCTATLNSQHPNQCAANLIAGLNASALGLAPTQWSGSGSAASPLTAAGPIVANYPAAAASVSQFTSFQPHSYSDALIGGIQLCAPNGSERCGIKQILDSGTGSYGVSMFETNMAKEIANCWSSTANPTADSAFTCASWFTSDGILHGSGLSITGSNPTVLPGTLTVNDSSAVASASSFSHLNPHSYSDALIDKWNVCNTDVCGIGMMNNAQGYGPGIFSTNTAKPVYLGCWSSVSNPTSESQFNCPVWTLSSGLVYSSGFVATGAGTVGTSTAVSGATLTVNGLTSGNGWSNGTNSTPIYNYSTTMGTQPGASSDEELFTTSGGTVSLGQLASGTFTPWATASSSTFNVLSKRVTNIANATALTDAVALGQLNGPLSANITLTTATTDSVTILGLTTASKCTFSPSNATAASVTATLAGYYTVASNSFTLHHVATSASGATYGVMCTIQ
jgi:hypothetical protein